MGGLRRAAVKVGGVGGPTPAAGNPGNMAATSGRTLGSPKFLSGLTQQPAYRVEKQSGGPHPFLDLSRVQTWRNIGALAAAGYVFGFHVSASGIRFRPPSPHGHPLGLGLYIGAWIYLLRFGGDALAAAHPELPAAAALHQAF